MKLRNKRTGEIGYTAVLRSKAIVVMDENAIQLGSYTSLAELNEEWEDAPEEPFSKDFYIIFDGEVKHCIWYRERVAACHDDAHAYLGEYGREQIDNLKSVGLYFATKEEAKKAVEKLKAWKRLKDEYDFKFTGWKRDDQFRGDFIITAQDWNTSDDKLLDLLFGGEE